MCQTDRFNNSEHGSTVDITIFIKKDNFMDGCLLMIIQTVNCNIQDCGGCMMQQSIQTKIYTTLKMNAKWTLMMKCLMAVIQLTLVTNVNNMAVKFTDLIDINLEVAKGDELIDITLVVHNFNSKNNDNNNTTNPNNRHHRNGNNKSKSCKHKRQNNILKFGFDSDFDLRFESNSNDKLANGLEKCDNTTLIGNINDISNYSQLEGNKKDNKNDGYTTVSTYGFDTKYNGGSTIYDYFKYWKCDNNYQIIHHSNKTPKLTSNRHCQCIQARCK